MDMHFRYYKLKHPQNHRDAHQGWELGHALEEKFPPLADNIIRNNFAQVGVFVPKDRAKNVIHIGESKPMINSSPKDASPKSLPPALLQVTHAGRLHEFISSAHPHPYARRTVASGKLCICVVQGRQPAAGAHLPKIYLLECSQNISDHTHLLLVHHAKEVVSIRGILCRVRPACSKAWVLDFAGYCSSLQAKAGIKSDEENVKKSEESD
jgi:hypothetical protein